MKDTDGTLGTGCMYNTAEANDIRYCQIGVAFYTADYNTAIGNTITNMTYLTSSASPAGFWIHECIGTKISDNKVFYSRYGVGYNTVGRGVNYDNVIDHNVFSVMSISNYAAGIQGGPNTTISENTLYYSGTNDGIQADTNCVVSGNRIYGPSTNEGLIRVMGNNATVKDNTIRSTTTSWYTIYVVGANFTKIVDNHIFDGKGISIGSGCNNTLVESNDFNTASTAIDNSGVSSLIRWNRGYKSEGSASSINATTTTWTFTMGNASTVLRAYISFNSTIANPYWSATGNTLTVTTGTIIAANNTACYVEWFCWNYP
jgi:parallel beta-helix repeat protein